MIGFDLTDPVEIGGHPRVDTRSVSLSTAETPRHNTSQLPVAVNLADERTAAITLTGVLAALPVAGTQVGGGDHVPAQVVVTHRVGDDRDVHFVQVTGGVAVFSETAPASDRADLVLEVFILVWQTG